MPYTTLTVIIEGCLASEEDFAVATTNGELAFREALRTIAEDSATDPDALVEVYLLNHDHDPLTGEEDCACVQYVQCHHPEVTYNQEDH